MQPDREAWSRERLAFGPVTLSLLFGVSTALGFVYARVGLVSAMAINFVCDVIVLQGINDFTRHAPS